MIQENHIKEPMGKYSNKTTTTSLVIQQTNLLTQSTWTYNWHQAPLTDYRTYATLVTLQLPSPNPPTQHTTSLQTTHNSDTHSTITTSFPRTLVLRRLTRDSWYTHSQAPDQSILPHTIAIGLVEWNRNTASKTFPTFQLILLTTGYHSASHKY